MLGRVAQISCRIGIATFDALALNLQISQVSLRFMFHGS